MATVPDGLWVNNGVSAQDARFSQTGLVAGALDASSQGVAARAGRLPGPGKPLMVGPTTPSASMNIRVQGGFAVTYRAGYGPVIMGAPGVTDLPVAAAPATGSRYELVYIKQLDSESPASDGSIAGTVDKVVGTAASSPTRPTIPVGALLLGEAQIFAGDTTVPSARITDKPVWTSMRGAPIPVLSSSERDSLTPYPGLAVYRLDNGNVEVVNSAGTAFVKRSGPVQVVYENGNQGSSGTIASGSAVVVSPITFTVPVASDNGFLSATLAIGTTTTSAIGSLTVAFAGISYVKPFNIAANSIIPVEFGLPVSVPAGTQTITVTLTWGAGGSIGVSYSSFRVTI